MTACRETAKLQDYLEALLPEPERLEMERHLLGCARCAAERVRLERLFSALDALPLDSPSPYLADRVLERVLPARVKARWMRRLGFGYAGALAASLGGVALWIAQPSAHAFLAWLAGAASSRLLHALVFLMNQLAFVALRVEGSWTAFSSFRALFRALIALAGTPALGVVLASSAAACVALLWWMWPRRHEKGMPHVGLLGF